MTKTAKLSDSTQVLYNGSCPVCSAEIGHYAAYSAKEDLPVLFEDLNATDLAQWGLSPEQAARRLHVRQNDQILSGIPAFQALWSEMPRYRWLARVTGWPGIRPLATVTYDYILAPLLYRWHRVRFAGAEKTGKSRQSS